MKVIETYQGKKALISQNEWNSLKPILVCHAGYPNDGWHEFVVQSLTVEEVRARLAVNPKCGAFEFLYKGGL